MSKQERRSTPRIEKEVPFKFTELDTSAKDLINTHSINISQHGVYCKTTRLIPVFTRVQILFELLSDSEENNGRKILLSCEGVVVRTELERRGAEKEYRIAIYFEETPEAMLSLVRSP
jgi:hypothetical protein